MRLPALKVTAGPAEVGLVFVERLKCWAWNVCELVPVRDVARVPPVYALRCVCCSGPAPTACPGPVPVVRPGPFSVRPGPFSVCTAPTACPGAVPEYPGYPGPPVGCCEACECAAPFFGAGLFCGSAPRATDAS